MTWPVRVSCVSIALTKTTRSRDFASFGRDDRDALLFLDQRHVGDRDGEVGFDRRDVGDDVDFLGLSFAADGLPDCDEALRHPSGDGRADLFLAQRGYRLIGQRGELRVRKVERRELLPCEIEAKLGFGQGRARLQKQLLRDDLLGV